MRPSELQGRIPSTLYAPQNWLFQFCLRGLSRNSRLARQVASGTNLPKIGRVILHSVASHVLNIDGADVAHGLIRPTHGRLGGIFPALAGLGQNLDHFQHCWESPWYGTRIRHYQAPPDLSHS